MIVHKVEQSTLAWLRLRAGIPTASNFDKILTAGGKASEQAEEYAYSLLAEQLVGHPISGPETKWMRRGNEMEPEAVDAYEFDKNAETDRAGFITLDDGSAGASPDRLFGSAGLVQIKCPAAHTHVAYLMGEWGGIEKKYRPQLQGELYVCEREWVEVVSYFPEMPIAITRVARDEEYIAKLASALSTFDVMLKRLRMLLEAKVGPFPEKIGRAHV